MLSTSSPSEPYTSIVIRFLVVILVMDELARLMDWDLQAILKGCTTEEEEEVPVRATTIIDNVYLNDSPHHFCSEQQDLFVNFHEFSETKSVLDELEDLYKPFYPVQNSPIAMVTNPLPIPEEAEQVKVTTAQDSKESAASKCKKSKKNRNRRVKEVTEEEAFSDGWAWRKYGQKPIKGSPYPRSYYRCSSSKGCLSRKQVERSSLDPQVFIVSYTGEHIHPQPTRRKNSLAGSTRKNNSSSMIAASSRTVNKSVVEDHGHVLPCVDDEQSYKGVEKEEDYVDLLEEDADGGNWFQSLELEEELKGLELDDQQLGFDGCGFMDTFDDDTWFNSSKDLT